VYGLVAHLRVLSRKEKIIKLLQCHLALSQRVHPSKQGLGVALANCALAVVLQEGSQVLELEMALSLAVHPQEECLWLVVLQLAQHLAGNFSLFLLLCEVKQKLSEFASGGRGEETRPAQFDYPGGRLPGLAAEGGQGGSGHAIAVLTRTLI
jgi:hypothetical protein